MSGSRKAKRLKQPKAPREKDADTKALERDLTAKLGLKTEIAFAARAARSPSTTRAWNSWTI
jgi:hypothetical protein